MGPRLRGPRDSKSAFTRVCDALCVAGCPSRGRPDAEPVGMILSHDVKQPISFPRRMSAPGFCIVLHSPRIEGWAERRETFGCSGTRWAYHDAIRQAPSEAPCVP